MKLLRAREPDADAREPVPEAEAPGPEVAARPARARKLRIGELLVAQGTISEDQLRAGLLEQKRTGRRLGEVLVELGVLGEATSSRRSRGSSRSRWSTCAR